MTDWVDLGTVDVSITPEGRTDPTSATARAKVRVIQDIHAVTEIPFPPSLELRLAGVELPGDVDPFHLVGMRADVAIDAHDIRGRFGVTEAELNPIAVTLSLSSHGAYSYSAPPRNHVADVPRRIAWREWL